jgi:enoyl-CoA hydratase/carnithine racemase
MIQFECRDGIGWLLLDRPEKLNAMAPSFWDDLPATMAAADADDEVRVVVVHGAGKCFSVGADIAAFADARGGDDASREFAAKAIGSLIAVEQARTPTIAAVHGYALGGGCELTLVCDLVVADETAEFGLPEAAIGLVPGLGLLRARAHMNLHWLKYMILTGRRLDAHHALIAGLVQEVVPAGEHLAEAERWGRLIAQMPPAGIAGAKEFFREEATARVEEAVTLVSQLQHGDAVDAGIAKFSRRRSS